VAGNKYDFSSWGGDCSGSSTTCTLTMNSNKALIQHIPSPSTMGMVTCIRM
jgi:hypothetical protein